MKKCQVIGCNDKHYSKGLCQRHYMKHIRGTLNEPIKDIDALLEDLQDYKDIIHKAAITVSNPKMKELFALLDSLIE